MILIIPHPHPPPAEPWQQSKRAISGSLIAKGRNMAAQGATVLWVCCVRCATCACAALLCCVCCVCLGVCGCILLTYSHITICCCYCRGVYVCVYCCCCCGVCVCMCGVTCHVVDLGLSHLAVACFIPAPTKIYHFQKRSKPLSLGQADDMVDLMQIPWYI